MALLERVATLLRANLNDLIDKAENPETLIKQVILDMENQLLQVKTQVAIAIADQHVLEKKRQQNGEHEAQWRRRAELAVDRQQDDLARAALERSLSHRMLTEGFDQQVADQLVQVENLKSALHQLERKLGEAKSKSDLLIARHRRARALRKTTAARSTVGGRAPLAAFERLQDRVRHAEATSEAAVDLAVDTLDERLAELEKQDEIERLLAEIKARRRAG